jgi:hypothetical protein
MTPTVRTEPRTGVFFYVGSRSELARDAKIQCRMCRVTKTIAERVTKQWQRYQHPASPEAQLEPFLLLSEARIVTM